MRYIGIIVLLVLCLALLSSFGCIINTVNAQTFSGDSGIHENTEESVKWSGLGMGTYWGFDSYVDTILANGFIELRIDIPSYENTTWLANSKTAVISAVGKGADVIWGVSAGTTLTSSNWADYRIAVLNAAQWAQANRVFEFQLGNELEGMIDDTTLTVTKLIANLKSLATEVQAIFTNGNISYSCWQVFIDDWITAGKGDIDILASNIYMGGDGYYGGNKWKTDITKLVNAFGSNGTYITEFNLSWSSLDDYSTDEVIQAVGIAGMIKYFKVSGIKRALYFAWKDDGEFRFGALKADDNYRLLWNQALLNQDP